MVKRRIQLRNVSNVALGKTALIDLPCGPRYHAVFLEHGNGHATNTVATAAANITEIRVKINGRVQRTISGTQLRDMNILNGAAYDGNGVPNTAPGVCLPIFFAEPWRKSPADQDALAWPSAGFSSFQIEVDLGSTASPTLVASAAVDDMQVGKLTGIVKWLRQSFASSGTSFDISTIDRRDWLQQISLYSAGYSPGLTVPGTPVAAGVLASKVTLRKDGLILHELTASSNLGLNSNYGMLPSQTVRGPGIYDLVLDHDDLLGSAVQMDSARDIVLTVESGSAMSGTLTAIVQRFGPPE